MKLFFSIMGLSVLFCYLAGCGNSHSVYRDFDVDDGSGAMVDIKQRAVIASKSKTTKEGITKEKTIVCAEPSPDALSAYAAEIAGEGSVPENVKAAFSAAFQENSAFVGLRTQSIQLLRDSLYRLCEGYMSGALDKPHYQALFRRYQKSMGGAAGHRTTYRNCPSTDSHGQYCGPCRNGSINICNERRVSKNRRGNFIP